MGNTPLSQLTARSIGENFDDVVIPHLNAARRLARALVGNEHDAEDVVQEASLKAFRYFRTYAGGSGRAWFLRIVRNACYDWQRHALRRRCNDLFDEESHSATEPAGDPETLALRTDQLTVIERAMNDLPDRSRQLLIHREIDGLSYREVAALAGIPIGTVMSGLSRARRALRNAVARQVETARRRGGERSCAGRAGGAELVRSGWNVSGGHGRPCVVAEEGV